LLVAHFLQQIAKEAGRKTICAGSARVAGSNGVAGNVHQLLNMVRKNVAVSQNAVIPAEVVKQSLGDESARPSFDEAREEFTRNYLKQN